jgi:hypothetical protein
MTLFSYFGIVRVSSSSLSPALGSFKKDSFLFGEGDRAFYAGVTA